MTWFGNTYDIEVDVLSNFCVQMPVSESRWTNFPFTVTIDLNHDLEPYMCQTVANLQEVRGKNIAIKLLQQRKLSYVATVTI